MDPALLEVTPTGVLAQLGVRDVDERWIQMRVDDRDGRRRRPGTPLAPVSAAVEESTCMPLVWMPVFDLVRTGGRGVAITVDGRAVTTGRLSMARLHGGRLIKYAADLVVVRVNPAEDGACICPVADPEGSAGVELAQVDGQPASWPCPPRPSSTARLALDPAYPDPAHLAAGVSAGGRWRPGIDQQAAGGGCHSCQEQQPQSCSQDALAGAKPVLRCSLLPETGGSGPACRGTAAGRPSAGCTSRRGAIPPGSPR